MSVLSSSGKKKLTKVETQMDLWAQRGVLDYLREWWVGNYNKGWSPCKMWAALEQKRVTDIELSPPQLYELNDKFMTGAMIMSNEDLLAALSGEIILGIQRKDPKIRERIADMAATKLAKEFGLLDEDDGKRAINININSSGFGGNGGTGETNRATGASVSERLSNIGVDTMEGLKGDPAYERLLKDREEEQRQNG